MRRRLGSIGRCGRNGLDVRTEDLIERAGRISRREEGTEVGFYVPGMFVYDGRRGRFPALSLTGRECSLGCEHCRGRLLLTMTPAVNPGELLAAARRAEQGGALGILVSGGCDNQGRLPWSLFLDDLARIKEETGLFVAVHSGFADREQAAGLASARVDLAMIDIVGDDETARRVYHLPGRERVEESLAALVEAGIEVAPHVVVGLDFGRMGGEEAAVEMIAAAGLKKIVFVVLMPLKKTGMEGLNPVPVQEAVKLLARTRISFPGLTQHLGCAKPRGAYHRELDCLALRAGVNRIAIPAPEAVDLAPEIGLEPVWAETCCALGGGETKE